MLPHKALRTGEAIAVSFFGSLVSAWRRQLPKRAPGKSVCRLLVVLSKPSVSMPRTRYDGSCWDAVRWNSADDWVKAAALASFVYPRCQMTRPVTSVGRYTF